LQELPLDGVGERRHRLEPQAADGVEEVSTVVGPEVITGSTRLKAGTAHKLVLNTISTVAMIRLGRTYGGLMVGLTPGNDKLRERARRSVILATGAPEDQVDQAIAAAGGDVRVALVSLLTGVDADSARARLEDAGGSVRKAVST
jgi:N-acetylmuramic acid 6-phosphate etherase